MSDKQLKIICYFLYRIYRTKDNSCYAETFDNMLEYAELLAEQIKDNNNGNT